MNRPTISVRSRRPYRLLYPLCLAAVIGSPITLADPSDKPRERWHQDIGVGYQQLAQTTGSLDDSATHYCAKPDAESFSALQHRWRSAFSAWQAIRFVDFGPIELNSRAWQLQFWPDAKNLVARKVGMWLNDEGSVNAERIAGDSVATQGFPAVEYLLFDQTLAEKQQLPAQKTCQLLNAITAHLRSVATALTDDWTEFGPHYIEQDRYDAATITAAINAVEILQDRRLAAPMGLRGNSKRNPYIADAWRSDYSLAATRASLDGLDAYFLPGLKILLSNWNKADLFPPLKTQLTETRMEAGNLPPAMRPLLGHDDGYRRLQSLFIEVNQLEQVLSGQVATQLGIVRGFNSSDGD